MIEKYLIMVTNKNATISNTVRRFTEEQKENGEMTQYIRLKTDAGFVCHEFDYNSTYQTQTNLIKSSL